MSDGKASRPKAAARWIWRSFRAPLVLLLSYLITEEFFVALVSDHGLFFHAVSAKSLAVVALGVVVLSLRLAVHLLLPGVIVYRVVMLLWERME